MTDLDFFSGLHAEDIALLQTSFRVKPDIGSGDRSMGIALGHHVRVDAEDASHVTLVLVVGVNSDDPELYEERGFSFEAHVSGVFGAEDLEDNDERKLFVLVNGLSLLYAEVRSYFAQFSSSSPLGRVILPSVNMLSYLKAVGEQQRECGDEQTSTAAAE